MPKGYPSTVFVSSTYYDLNQIRRDIKDFIESLGFDCMLSEFDSFPVNPDLGTIENCLEVVEQRADIFVLIVGGRYGSITDSGKSITNLEYLRARAKGIPIYVFVMESILYSLPFWKKNPTANFEGIVDSPKLFEFIELLVSSKEHWVHPFKSAQERKQCF